MTRLFFPLYWLGCFISLSVVGIQAAQAQTKPIDSRLSVSALRQTLAVLTADSLRGRSLRTGADAAASYLAAQFKQAGLQPPPGQSGFEQVFPLYELRAQQLTAEINGVALARTDAVLLPGRGEIAWSSTSSHPRLLRIGPDADLSKYIADSVFKAPGDLLVLVDPKHERWFNSLAAHYWHHYQYQLAAPTATVVLLRTANLAPASYQVAGRTGQRVVQARNVVGVLPGRSPAHAAEQVIFGAHYDHLGILPAVAGDSIANGADDDASGTAAVLALARYYQHRHDNARTLVFVAFTAEEVGEFGSQYFASQLPDASKVTAMFNLEMLGTPAKFGPGTAFITGFDQSDFGAILQRSLQGTPYRFEPDPYPDQYLFYRSDNYKLARLGVPAHTISTVQLPTDKLYHTVGDELSTLDLPNLSAVVQAVALSARGIVAGRDIPTRVAPAKP